MKPQTNTISNPTSSETLEACERVVDRPKSCAHAYSVSSQQPEATHPEINAHISPNDATRSMGQSASIVARPGDHPRRTLEVSPFSTPSIELPLFSEVPRIPSSQDGSASRLHESNVLPRQKIVDDIPIQKGPEISACPHPTRFARSSSPNSPKEAVANIYSSSSYSYHPVIHSSPGILHANAVNDQDIFPVAEPFGRPCAPYGSPARPARHAGNVDAQISLVRLIFFYPSAEQTFLTLQSLSVPEVDSLPTHGATVRAYEQIPLPHVNHVLRHPVSNARGHEPRPGVTSVSKPWLPSVFHCLTGTERGVPPFPTEDKVPDASRSPAKRSTSPIGGFSTPFKKARIQTRLASPPSSPLRLRPPPCLVSSSKSVRAYMFGAEDSDPDASWSTFSATKLGKRTPALGTRARKPRNGPNDGIKKSGTFRLPGVGLGRQVKFGESAHAPPLPPQQEQKRRVITYLPPPPQMPKTESGGASDRKINHCDTKRESRELDTCTRRKDTMIKCHVLLDSDAGSGTSAATTECEQWDDNDLSAVVPLMDSDDATLVGEEYDLHESSPPVTVPFDIDDVCRRYSQIRAKIKEVCALFSYD
ncbi:hypothetical protein EDD17DRAFT_1652441, partial [Pisolithus thermaeus]